MADYRRYLIIIEWQLFLSGLRNRLQVWSKENGTPAAFNRANADQRWRCLFAQNAISADPALHVPPRHVAGQVSSRCPHLNAPRSMTTSAMAASSGVCDTKNSWV